MKKKIVPPTRSKDDYIEAAVAENTRNSYRSDVIHYERAGGILPARAQHIIDYLYLYSETLNPDTLSRRLAGIGKWHQESGFPDPTSDTKVRTMLAGIRRLNATPPRGAYPLLLTDIDKIVQSINVELAREIGQKNPKTEISANHVRLKRDRSMILLLFWRAMRASHLTALTVNAIHKTSINGQDKLELTYAPDKTNPDTFVKRSVYAVTKQEIQHLCPLQALEDYLAVTNIQKGPVFRKVSIGGQLSDDAMHPNSLNNWIKKLTKNAGVISPDHYSISSHSCRAGFGTQFASAMDIRSLMDYVGWKSISVALKYIRPIWEQQNISKITTDSGTSIKVNQVTIEQLAKIMLANA